MFRHYFRTAVGHLKKHAFYTIITVIGLSLGVAAFIVLMNYVHHERSFDSFNADAGRIYRAEAYFEKNGEITDLWASSSFGYAKAMKDAMPEIQDITRINNYDCERIVRYQNNIYREPRVVFADSNFFSFFSYPLLKGNVKEVLKNPNTIAISETMSKKYFGNEDPMGKMLEIKNQANKYHCMVTGVFKDFPSNSHLQLGLLMSYMTTEPWERDLWYMHEAYTYAKCNTPAEAKSVERKFPSLAENYKTDPVTMKDHLWGVKMIPLRDIHLNPAKPYEREVKGNARMISFLFIVGIMILIVGWINYINIAISKTLQRAGEISIRKVAGASQSHLFKQFLAESLIVNFFSLLLVIILLLAFNGLSQQLFAIRISHYLLQWKITGSALLFAFVTGTFITGIIPVIILKNLNIARVLKNKSSFNNSFGLAMREALIGFQYFAAIVLIVATLTIQKQMHFMQTADTGAKMEQTLIVQTPAKEDNYEQRLQTFTEELNRINDIKTATISSSVPGKPIGFVMANKRADDPEKRSRLTNMFRVDENYIPAYGLQLVKGRNFSRDRPVDKTESVILNEAAVKFFGFKNNDDALSGYLLLEGQNDKRFPVIGILKNYHHLSMKEDYAPFAMITFSPWNVLHNQFISIKLNSSNISHAVNTIEQKFKAAFPSTSFDAYFLDELFNRQYEADLQYGKMIRFFAWLALAIVCLGIFGLSSFILLKRTTEIGIRKIIGAETFQILVMLNARFIKTLGISLLAAIPFSWIIMNQWLLNFANRTAISWWIFVMAAMVTMAVSVITVCLQSYKTVTGNMVNALRE